MEAMISLESCVLKLVDADWSKKKLVDAGSALANYLRLLNILLCMINLLILKAVHAMVGFSFVRSVGMSLVNFWMNFVSLLCSLS